MQGFLTSKSFSLFKSIRQVYILIVRIDYYDNQSIHLPTLWAHMEPEKRREAGSLPEVSFYCVGYTTEEGGKRMTTEEEFAKESSLLRCTLKKSRAVSKKIGLWLGGIAVVMIACYCGYIGATSPAAANFAGWCISAAGTITGLIELVPWELWAIIIGVVVIFVYSLSWCMARNLTDEDWQSKTARNVAFALIFAIAIAAFALIFAIAIAAFAIFAIALTIVLAALTTAFTTLANSKAVLFIGAYLHYRKRIKTNKGE